MAEKFNQEVDWLVAGTGVGGLTGAVVAHELGAEVLVVESASVYGGTTAHSGGVAWIPGHHLQSSVGIEDSKEEGYQYLRSLIGDTVKEERLRAYADKADEMLQFMHKHSRVKYTPLPAYMDYYEQHQGSKHGGRSMCPGAFTLRQLGKEAAYLRRGPFQGLGMPFSMTVVESSSLMRMNLRSYLIGAKLMLRYWLDIPSRLKGTSDDRISCGEALIARLRKTLMDRDIPLWLDSPVVELIKQDNKVIGAVINKKGQTVSVKARKGVLLATGGFASNLEMREQYHPKPTSTEWTAASPDSNGDGIRLGQSVGAAVNFMSSAWWSPSYTMPNGQTISLIAGKAMPGSIMVNRIGKRFTNEAQPYEDVVKEQYLSEQRGEKAIPCYLIFDANYRSKYVIGHIKPTKLESDDHIPKDYFETGLLTKASSLLQLAEKLDIDAAQLVETVTQFNANAIKGIDPDFGRGETLHDRYYADAKVIPNPSLAPIDKGPFYAFKIEAGDLDTKGGIVCDEWARVCDNDGSVIEGLYGAGNTTAAVMGDTYPGAGATIGSAMTFAYIAAQYAIS